MSDDVTRMRRALDNATRGWGQTAPNPMVGAVLVKNGDVIADGWHQRFGEPHAEVVALRTAGEAARGATMYVTLEPCTHFGKTPPCADALIAAGVARVVVAARDPNPIAGGGVERLRNAGIDVTTGVLDKDAREQNAAFFHSFLSNRPWVTLKFGVGEGDAVADPKGKLRWITSEESRREVHRLRSNADAIAVGVGTVLADDPDLTVRDVPAPRVPPVRVVFDRKLRTPSSARVVKSSREVQTWIVGLAGSPADETRLTNAGVTVVQAGSIAQALRALRDRGIRSLFLEGGPALAGAFLTEEYVDRLILFDAPVDVGPGAPTAFAHAPPGFGQRLRAMPVIREAHFGADTMTEYALSAIP